MRQQDYRRHNLYRGYFGKLIRVTVRSLFLGTVVIIVGLIVGYSRLKPLQAIYLWQYLTSARRSSRSETGVSEYRVLVRIVPDPDPQPEAANPTKDRSKGRSGLKKNAGLEATLLNYFICNDDQVDAVYVNGEQSRTSEGDRKFRLKQEAPNEKMAWQTLSVNDLKMWSQFGKRIYGVESVGELIDKPRRYGVLIFAISLIAGLILVTKKHFQVSITDVIKDEISGIQQLQIMGLVVTKVDVLKGFFVSCDKAAIGTALRTIANKSAAIPARKVTQPAEQKEARARQIEPVTEAQLLTNGEPPKEESITKFGLELFGGETKESSSNDDHE